MVMISQVDQINRTESNYVVIVQVVVLVTGDDEITSSQVWTETSSQTDTDKPSRRIACRRDVNPPPWTRGKTRMEELSLLPDPPP